MDEFYIKLLEELKGAVEKGYQPRCPNCEKLLEISEQETTILKWKWDDGNKKYCKDEDGAAEIPFCRHCLYEDWNLLSDTADTEEIREILFKLGLHS